MTVCASLPGWTTASRDLTSLKAEAIKHVYFGLLVGITFYGNGLVSAPFILTSGTPSAYPSPTLTNFAAIYFFLLIVLFFGNLQFIPNLCAMDLLYRRELASGSYTPFPYWFAAIFVRLPIQLLLFTVLIGIWYPMGRFPGDPGYFFTVYIILFLTGMMSYYLAQGFAALTRNAQIAFAVVSPLYMVFASFSGFPLLLSHMPSWLRVWAPYLTYMRWSMDGLMTLQFSPLGRSFVGLICDFMMVVLCQ